MMTRCSGDCRKHRYLVTDRPRAELASALLEYRRFAEDHPADPLAGGYNHVDDLRAALAPADEAKR